MNQGMKTAVIAGAGPAGLTAAYELLKRTDIRPIIFEQTDMLGGISQTYAYKGNRIDIGGHRFFSKSDRVMQWWFNILPPQGAPAADTLARRHEIEYAGEVTQELLLGAQQTRVIHRLAPDPEREDDVMLQRPRLSRIFYRGHFFPYPLGITFGIARRLGLWNTALIGLSYLKARLFSIKDETYLDAFFVNRFGKRLYETFFRAYTEKVWGLPCSKIRADWGTQRVKGLSLKRALVLAVKDSFRSEAEKAREVREVSLITRFYYPKYGPGQMWETVGRQITAAGGEIHLHERVTGISLEGGTVREVTVEDGVSGRSRQVRCDYFFSSMPVKELVAMMVPPPPDEVRDVAAGLVYRDFLTVGLLLKSLHVREQGREPASTVPDNWIYVQDPGVRVGRLQVFNNWSPYLVADPGNTVWVGMEYFVDEGDDLWRQADGDLVALATRELEQIGMARAHDVLDGCVLRMPKAYPAYFGSYPQLDTIRRFTDGIPNLFLVGRNGMHRYNNQDHSMLTAMTAVDNILAGERGKANLWNVNLESEYHEEKKT